MPKLESLQLEPAVLRWARERAELELGELATRLKVPTRDIEEWEGSGRIAFKKAEALAKKTHTPVGYLYLSEPPRERLPIADFRTRSGSTPPRPSPDLLETVYQMQLRQAWMREEMISLGIPPLPFIGAFPVDSSPAEVAAAMGDALQMEEGWASADGTWTDALRTLRDHIAEAGILVFFNGVVGNNVHRKLQAEEFQGFAMVDDYAPLIFVNNADFKTAQIFTLAHELAHVFVGESGISKFEALSPADHAIEQACNRIAAEFLVPSDQLRNAWGKARQSHDPHQHLARHFKVSTVVAARRALDAGLVTREAFFRYYEENKAKHWGGAKSADGSSGGDFWNTQRWRLGTGFAAAVSRAVVEGRLSYTEGYTLTGLRGDTFSNIPEKMGILL